MDGVLHTCDHSGHRWRPRDVRPGESVSCPKCGVFHSKRAGFLKPPSPPVVRVQHSHRIPNTHHLHTPQGGGPIMAQVMDYIIGILFSIGIIFLGSIAEWIVRRACKKPEEQNTDV